MTEVTLTPRKPGRPLTVRPEAKVEVEAAPVAAEPEVKLCEILLLRKYVPMGAESKSDSPGVLQAVPAGSKIMVPQAEATRAIQLGIANVTDRTFA